MERPSETSCALRYYVSVGLAGVAVVTILAKSRSPERSCPDESLDLGREEPSFNHTRHSHSSGCDRIRHNRAARANARGLLGCDRYFGRNAIYSWRNANALARANRRDLGGRVSGSARGKFLWRTSSPSQSRLFSSDCSRSRFV